MARRYNMQVEVPADVRTVMDEVCSRTGMTKVCAIGRLLEWFAQQDEFTQLAVLGIVSEGMQQDMARTILERLAAGEQGKPPSERRR